MELKSKSKSRTKMGDLSRVTNPVFKKSVFTRQEILDAKTVDMNHDDAMKYHMQKSKKYDIYGNQRGKTFVSSL